MELLVILFLVWYYLARDREQLEERERENERRYRRRRNLANRRNRP